MLLDTPLDYESLKPTKSLIQIVSPTIEILLSSAHNNSFCRHLVSLSNKDSARIWNAFKEGLLTAGGITYKEYAVRKALGALPVHSYLYFEKVQL